MAVEPQYRRADELNPGDFLVYVSPLEVQDNDSINESMLRILGFYTASGVISFNRHLNMYQMLFSFRENENASELYSIIKIWGSRQV
ncbi:hypothetical protein [Acidiplasma cupricumulans]|uniref:hypothetical protein n=1 Tax=Acidiplasma cupricumulans TaxID=312540 RepID=UPI00078105D4|nr:hypothetical protein [Acidiplasma cupricumulans]